MEFFKNLKEGVSNSINKCILGKIDSFNGLEMKATVEPLVKDGTESKPLLIEVPVSFINSGGFTIKPSYSKGDIVVVIFADEDIDNVLLSGKTSNANTNRKHSLDDAIIIGSIMPFNEKLPSKYKDDLVIGKNDFSSTIVIKESGAIELNSNQGITINGRSKSESW